MGSDARVTLTVRAELDELNHINSQVEDDLKQLGCPQDMRYKVSICLEELFVNVCNYAYAASGDVSISFIHLNNPSGIRIEIVDTGLPFDPLAHPDPHLPNSVDEIKIGGLGIFMVKKIAEAFTYERREGCNITSFELRW